MCLTAVAQEVKAELPLATMTACCHPLKGAEGFCVDTVGKTRWRVTTPVVQVREGFREQKYLPTQGNSRTWALGGSVERTSCWREGSLMGMTGRTTRVIRRGGREEGGAVGGAM